MNIQAIYDAAPQRLRSAPQEKKIVLIYAGVTVGFAALITVINYVLGLQIDQTGGLSNMGLRSILSTVQSVLPVVQMVVMMCFELGYQSAMLRVSRGQYASAQSLRLGFARFGPLVRSTILQSLIYMGVGMLSFWLAMQIYMVTPLSDGAMALLEPVTADSTILTAPASVLLDEAFQLQLMEAMVPLFLLFAALCVAFCVPVMYQYRMMRYVIIDNPRAGGMSALGESRKMMRRNRFQLFKLDLRLWWYHLLCALALAVCYGDVILALLGIRLPVSDTVLTFGFYALYLAAQFGICYFLRNRVDVTYALAYEELRPKAEEKENAVVLGNIFQM